jgi:hypothetical protein
MMAFVIEKIKFVLEIENLRITEGSITIFSAFILSPFLDSHCPSYCCF